MKGAKILLMLSAFVNCTTKSEKEISKEIIHQEQKDNYVFVAHGAGGINHITYSNSNDAFNLSLHNGFQLIELDFVWTLDNKLVVLHDWFHNFNKFYGSKGIRSYKDFMSEKMNYGLTRLALDHLLELFKRNKNFSIITDIKSKNIKGLKFLNDFFSDYKNRIIPQIYNFSEFKSVKELGFEKVILTLYKMRVNRIKLVNFLKGKSLFGVTVPKNLASNKQLIESILKTGHRVFTHTVNTKKEVKHLIKNKIHGVYTDFLVPSDFE